MNNTVVGIGTTSVPTVFRLFDGISALNAHNNVLWREGSNGVRVVREVEADWRSGTTRIYGSNNWIDSGSTYVPAGFINTLGGSNPGFVSVAARNFRLAAGSPLIGTANPQPRTPTGFEIAAPVLPALRLSPVRAHTLPGTPFPPQSGPLLDIGAYQLKN
jgi:hypothetical protein